MSLTAKVSSIDTNSAGHDQPFRGDGSIPGGFTPGGPKAFQMYQAEYDFDRDGALAVGANGLGVFVPANFVVTRVDFEVLVVPAGPTEVALSLENDGDLTPSAAVAGAPWSTVGRKSGAQVNAGAVNVAKTVQAPKTSAVREVLISADDAVTTAGHIVVTIIGYVSRATV
jgi:hypothetical protein